MRNLRRILFVAHYFPPLGGAGVQRSLKFVKYLPELGFLPVVLTGPGKADGRWAPEDKTLMAEVPAEVSIHRAAWNTGNGQAQPPAGIARARTEALIQTGEAAGRKNETELIFVSMSPFDDSEVAATLSVRLGIPWMADLRDPWALDEFQVHRTRWHRLRERRRMQRSLKTASLIIMNTPEAARQFRLVFPTLAGIPVVALTNGYDADDFKGPTPERTTDRFMIVHSGYLHTQAGLRQQGHPLQYRLLGRTETGVQLLSRSHFYLLQALEQWQREDAAIADTVRLVLVGAPTDSDRHLVAQSTAAGMVEFTGYVSHSESIRWVRGADLLFLPMHSMPPGRRASIVPGKTYEYMASGQPILAAVSEGDARDFLTQAGTGLVCEPDDVTGMLRVLKSQHQAWKTGKKTVTANTRFIEEFERQALTQKLASALATAAEKEESRA